MVWLYRGAWHGITTIDEQAATRITASLDEPGTVLGTPYRLAANDALVIEGVKIVGEGFILDDADARHLLETDPANVAVVRPFMTGRDINSRKDHSPSRHIINFRMWPLDRGSAPSGYNGPVATDYPDCLRIVEDRVKPERLKYPPDSSWNRSIREKWWQFGLPRPALMNAVKGMTRVLVRSRVSNINIFVFAPPDITFADTVNVFFFSSYDVFAVLQSSLHTAWLQEYASTMKSDIRYTPATCFDTLVLPSCSSAVTEIGTRYYDLRSDILRRRSVGATPLYNLVYDPLEAATDIRDFRHLHVEMDKAVVAAYGWSDLDLGHGFHETKQGLRFTISETARREVLARLLKLNHERYADEVAQGLHDKKKGGTKKRTKQNTDERCLFD